MVKYWKPCRANSAMYRYKICRCSEVSQYGNLQGRITITDWTWQIVDHDCRISADAASHTRGWLILLNYLTESRTSNQYLQSRSWQQHFQTLSNSNILLELFNPQACLSYLDVILSTIDEMAWYCMQNKRTVIVCSHCGQNNATLGLS